MSAMKTGTIHFGSLLHGKFGACFWEWGQTIELAAIAEQCNAKHEEARKRTGENGIEKMKVCCKARQLHQVIILWCTVTGNPVLHVYLHSYFLFLPAFFILLCSVVLCLRPCFVTMLIHWIYHHKWDRHTQPSTQRSYLACTRKILALIYTIHFGKLNIYTG